MIRDRGSISFQALAIGFFVAALAGVVALVLGAGRLRLDIALRESTEEAIVVKALTTVLEALSKDGTPAVDSRQDIESVASLVIEGVKKLELRDESSRFNPNYIRKNLIEKTRLMSMMVAGGTPQALQQQRVDKGLSTDLIGAYKAFFSKETLEKYFTVYSFASVNTDDEFALERLYFEATGDKSGASSFHASVQRQLMELRILKPSELTSYYGSTISKVAPPILADAQVNVNFADPFIIETVLSYPTFGFSDPSGAVNAIVATAAATEIDAIRLRSILGVAENHPALAYLGAKTWFWRLTIETDTFITTAMIYRVPNVGQVDADTSKRLKVAEITKRPRKKEEPSGE